MSRSRYHIGDPAQPHFLTCTIVAWLPVFARPAAAQIILDSWRYLQNHNRMTLYGYVILENHLHFVASSPDLSKELGDFKSFTARKILDHLETEHAETLLQELRFFKLAHKTESQYQLWQEGSHPQYIESDEVLRQKLDYIHANPVRRGYVDDATHWRYSSARNYAGQPGLLEVLTSW
jgi:REP element-mobilizing transposase RayT